MAADDALVFLPVARPVLASGEYTLTITQSVVDAGSGTLETFARSQKLVVRTPRFSLEPSLLLTTYPPDGHEGQYAGDLPHVVLGQDTLPWQLAAAGQPGGDSVPWLALLLFEDSEPFPEPVTMKVGDLATCPAGVYPPRNIRAEEDADASVTVITLSTTLFQRVAPRLDDLPWLTHARTVAVGSKATSADDKPGGDYAVIVGNRACLPGRRHVVHLISLEGIGDLLPGGREPPPGMSAIRLVTLASWGFGCTTENGTFAGQLGRVDLGPMALPVRNPNASDSVALKTVKEAYARGYCGLNHQLRGGGNTVSWYRGPLLPLKTSTIDIPRPSTSADQLLRYDPDLGMFDVSYAAAWQVGRLLALTSKEFSRALYRGKSRAVQEAALARQNEEAVRVLSQPAADPPQAMARATATAAAASGISSLPKGVHTATSRTACPFDPRELRDILRPPAPARPADDIAGAGTDRAIIGDWLSRLYLLYGVPLNYLVPDLAMLPEESIRFFRVDRNWVLALLDGALSIGGGDNPLEETYLHRSLIDQALAGLGDVRRLLIDEDDGSEAPDETKPVRMVSGCLLRSQVITGWPGLEVQAFSTVRREAPLELLRMEKVAPGILLCIFRGALRQLDLIEPPEGLCFVEPANGERRGDVLAVSALAARLKTKDAAHFAAAMVRDGRMVTFEMRDQQP